MRWWPFRRRGEQRMITFGDVWGSGADVARLRGDSMDTAVTLIPVYAAVRLIAGQVASMPLETFRRVDDVHMRIANPSLVDDPSKSGTVYAWVQQAIMSLVLRGNAYGMITSVDGNGVPTRIQWLHPDDVGLYQDDTAYPIRWFWRGREVDPNLMVHVADNVPPGKVLGLSPINAYKLTVETGLHAQRFGRDWFRNGSTPAAVLETDHEVTQEQAETIKTRFKQAAKGRDPVALGLGTTYKPISVPAEESQFLATARMTKTDIANVYGIPPELIGGETGSSLTYNTAEQQQIQLVKNALRPYMTMLELAVSRLLLSPQYVRFNADAVLRADTSTRYAAHHLALADGWMSRDEVRALEHLPPLPGGEGANYTSIMPARAETAEGVEQ